MCLHLQREQCLRGGEKKGKICIRDEGRNIWQVQCFLELNIWRHLAVIIAQASKSVFHLPWNAWWSTGTRCMVCRIRSSASNLCLRKASYRREGGQFAFTTKCLINNLQLIIGELLISPSVVPSSTRQGAALNKWKQMIVQKHEMEYKYFCVRVQNFCVQVQKFCARVQKSLTIRCKNHWPLGVKTP